MLENGVVVLKYFLDNYCNRYVNILNKSLWDKKSWIFFKWFKNCNFVM